MAVGYLVSFLSLLIMSASVVLNKFGLSYVHPTTAALLGMLFVALISAVYEIATKGSPRFTNPFGLIAIGVTNTIGVLLYYLSLQLLDPTTFSFIGRFSVVFGILLAPLVLRERVRLGQMPFILLAVGGTFLFVGGGAEVSFSGLILAFGFPFFFALAGALVKLFATDVTPNQIVLANSVIAIPVLLAYGLIMGEGLWLVAKIDGIYLVLAGALFSGFVGLILFYKGLRHISYIEANLIRSLGPLAVAAMSIPFFPPKLSMTNALGGLLLLLSLVGLVFEAARSSLPLRKQSASAMPQLRNR